jgi:hypothetical protein
MEPTTPEDGMKMKTLGRLAAKSMRALAGRAYTEAVADLALTLKKSLRAGTLRDWQEGDGDRYRNRENRIPFFRLQDEVDRGYVRGRPERIGLVLIATSSLGAAAKHLGPDWRDEPTLSVAVTAMALDVLAHAEQMGWTPKARRAA